MASPTPAASDSTIIAPVSHVVVGLHDRAYVDWSAVLGGAFIGVSLWTLLTSFGASVGLFVAPPWESVRETATTLTLATAAWFALVQLFASASGGYLAGRMRHRIDAGPPGEIAFRDGVNGLLVWAVGLFAAAALAVVAGMLSVAAVADNRAATSASPTDVNIVIDRLFRPQVAGAQESVDGATATPTIAIVPRQPRTAVDREEILRMLDTADSNAAVSAQDRAYLASLVAARTNLNPADAEARVNKELGEWQAERKAAWEKARTATALLGFWSVAVLLASGAAAWWAGSIGGRHRDDFV